MVQEGRRLSTLIDKLLDLSRLQSGRAAPRRDWISLEEVVLVARDGLGERIDLRVAIDPDVPAIRADAAQLERASQTCSRTPGLLRGATRVRPARRAGSEVIVRVVDQGGIGHDEQARIFELFYRGARDRGRLDRVGAGLAIVKGFVEANGGSVSVDSLPGQGASFVISLPAEETSVAA